MNQKLLNFAKIRFQNECKESPIIDIQQKRNESLRKTCNLLEELLQGFCNGKKINDKEKEVFAYFIWGEDKLPQRKDIEILKRTWRI